MKNKTTLITSAIFVALLLGSFANAAGIVSPYWKDYPLQMNRGDTKVVEFYLQNMVGEKEITVEILIKKGADIATLEKTTYTAPLGTSDTLVPLTIEIPKNYDKQVQPIELEFKTVNPSSEGMIAIGTGWTASFDVVISDKEVSKSTLAWMVLILIAVILVLGLIIFVVVKRRK